MDDDRCGGARLASIRSLPMKTVAFLTSALLALALPGLAEPPAETPPEKAAVVATDRAYEAAYAKGDAKALAEFFAEDAEYTTDDGRTFTGRAAIEGALRAG